MTTADPLNDLADVIGRPGALALAAVAGGGRLYVPTSPVAGSWLVRLLGDMQVARLVDRFGGDTLELPLPPVAAARSALVHELRAENYSVDEIADRVGLCRRSVFRILAEVTPVTL